MWVNNVQAIDIFWIQTSIRHCLIWTSNHFPHRHWSKRKRRHCFCKLSLEWVCEDQHYLQQSRFWSISLKLCVQLQLKALSVESKPWSCTLSCNHWLGYSLVNSCMNLEAYQWVLESGSPLGQDWSWQIE